MEKLTVHLNCGFFNFTNSREGPTLMELLKKVCESIVPLDRQMMTWARERMDNLTKPVGSLGRLEDIAVRLSGITGKQYPDVDRGTLIVMAADNGVWEEGVAAYPQQVTALMAKCMIDGFAGVSVLAKLSETEVRVIDIGIRGDIKHDRLENRRVMNGTMNMAKGPAMTYSQAIRAIETGIDVVFESIDKGSNVIATGEIGIGNTTTSSAVLAVLGGFDVAAVTGRGAGLDDKALADKIQTIKKAIELNNPNPEDPIDVLSKVGGLDIAGMAGVFLGSAFRRVPVIIDGFISSVAAMVASRLCQLSAEYMFPSHLSAEGGAGLALKALGMTPYFDMGMRLGEGSGAVMALLLLKAAVGIMKGMKTFEEVGITKQC
jgi:nicotinate-nucleotide--dimethylbenzimidazole phosphoribosyltransferase